MDLNNLDDLNELASAATRNLKRFFEGDLQHTEKEQTTARIAASAIATWAKAQQARGSQRALSFAMARELAGDKTQLEQYVRLAFPEVPVLTGGA